jgi:hypothetical protein
LDPSSRVLSDHYSEIVAEYRFLGYTTLEHARVDVLNLVPDHWSVVRSKLPSVPFRTDDLARLVRRRCMLRAACWYDSSHDSARSTRHVSCAVECYGDVRLDLLTSRRDTSSRY